MVKIDKNIPMPGTRAPSKIYELPFKEMEIGDSFLAEGLSRNQVAYLTHYAYWKFKRKFATRQEPSGLFRIWRIE